jgi:hypothetical protein
MRIRSLAKLYLVVSLAGAIAFAVLAACLGPYPYVFLLVLWYGLSVVVPFYNLKCPHCWRSIRPPGFLTSRDLWHLRDVLDNEIGSNCSNCGKPY